MVDVLLLSPPYKGMIREPIGLFYLANILIKNDISIKIIDLNVYKMHKKEFNDYIKKTQPKIIGITSYTFNFYITLDILKEIKINHPKIVTILGGVHASALPTDILLEEQLIDYIVIGEGELTFSELCQKILREETCEKVDGIAYLDGEVKINSRRKPIENLDFLQIPDREIINNNNYPIALVQTSRGCPYSCIFCNICNYYERTIRFRSPTMVVDECENLVKRYKYNKIYFFGDAFTLDKQWVESFSEEILKRGIKFEWACETRVDNVDLSILMKMREVGCRTVQFGIDYGDEEVLKKLSKNTSIESISDAVNWAKKSDLMVEAFFIFNCPGENQDTMNNTFNLIQKLPIDALEINLLTPYPGTKLWSDFKQLGMKIIDKNFSNYTTKKYVLENESFPKNKFVPAFKDLLKRLNLHTPDGAVPEIFNFLEKEKKLKTWL